jgi:hypothetical protein
MPGGVIGRIAHVEYIERARAVGAEALQCFEVDAHDAEPLGDTLGRGLGPGEAIGGRLGETLGLAVVRHQAREAPAHGAVAQCHDLVRQAGIDQ